MHLQVQWDNRLMTLGYLRQHLHQPTERIALKALPVLSSEGEGEEEEEGDTRGADEQEGTKREEQKQQDCFISYNADSFMPTSISKRIRRN